jgi:sugar phosphate isomerase/epimerase
LAAYSFRDALTGKTQPAMTLDDFVRLCADYDVDGAELTSYYFPKDFDEAYLIHLKQLTFRLGLDIAGTAIANDFCLPDGEQRTKALAHTRTWIDHAAKMGAPVIRIFAGVVPAGDTEAAVIDRCAAGINESLEHAARRGVCLALENHGGITTRPEQMLAIIGKVRESPWFGVNFDSGNFSSADPYADLARIAPYAINAQVKVDVRRDGRSEPADLEKVVDILRAAGYRGYLTLEYESKENPQIAVPRHLAELRRLISRA